MRWHTDRPIPELRRTTAIRPIVPVDMDRIGAPARVAYAKARAYFRNKIRAQVRQRKAAATEDND
jgi:hypothetical protein